MKRKRGKRRRKRKRRRRKRKREREEEEEEEEFNETKPNFILLCWPLTALPANNFFKSSPSVKIEGFNKF